MINKKTRKSGHIGTKPQRRTRIQDRRGNRARTERRSNTVKAKTFVGGYPMGPQGRACGCWLRTLRQFVIWYHENTYERAFNVTQLKQVLVVLVNKPSCTICAFSTTLTLPTVTSISAWSPTVTVPGVTSMALEIFNFKAHRVVVPPGVAGRESLYACPPQPSFNEIVGFESRSGPNLPIYGPPCHPDAIFRYLQT